MADSVPESLDSEHTLEPGRDRGRIRPRPPIPLLLALLALLPGCQEPPRQREPSIASTAAATEVAWRPLFDGTSLTGWTPSDYVSAGEPRVENGEIVLPVGEFLTGITWSGSLAEEEVAAGQFARNDYEIELEAKRVSGVDFFCGLTFPFDESTASLIVGGWGGDVCGISSVDDRDAGRSENPTHSTRSFETGRWYRIRLLVTPERIAAWIDGEVLVDLDPRGKGISPRGDVSPSEPLGIASFQTEAALRDIRWRPMR